MSIIAFVYLVCIEGFTQSTIVSNIFAKSKFTIDLEDSTLFRLSFFEIPTGAYVSVDLRQIVTVVLLDETLGAIHIFLDCPISPPLAYVSVFVKHPT